MQWLRRSLVTGFVVTVPLIITVAAFVWLFQLCAAASCREDDGRPVEVGCQEPASNHPKRLS